MRTEFPEVQTLPSPVTGSETETAAVLTSEAPLLPTWQSGPQFPQEEVTGGIGLTTLRMSVHVGPVSFVRRIINLLKDTQRYIVVRPAMRVPKEVTAVSSVTDARLAELRDGITELKMNPELEWTPTAFALSSGVRVLSDAYAILRLSSNMYYGLPRPSFTTDEDGGVRARWVHNRNEVRANCGADSLRRSYLYFEADQAHGIEQLRPDLVAGRLQWLLNT
jgi:hypothetical protein